MYQSTAWLLELHVKLDFQNVGKPKEKVVKREDLLKGLNSCSFKATVLFNQTNPTTIRGKLTFILITPSWLLTLRLLVPSQGTSPFKHCVVLRYTLRANLRVKGDLIVLQFHQISLWIAKRLQSIINNTFQVNYLLYSRLVKAWQNVHEQ